MFTLAVSNYKGGVGKTTTAVNLGTIYANQGKRVLLIDLDPQASATDYFGLYDQAQEEHRTSIELLYGNAAIKDIAYQTSVSNLSIIPSIIELVDQNEMVLREQRLKFALDDAEADYDIVIIDCSPVMKRLAFMAYLATSSNGMLIIPVKLDASVMRGTALTVDAADMISDELRIPALNYRILRTCVPGRQTRSEIIGSEILDNFFPNNQFQTVIHSSTKVCEGSFAWQPVVTYEPNSRPAKDYLQLAKEIENVFA